MAGHAAGRLVCYPAGFAVAVSALAVMLVSRLRPSRRSSFLACLESGRSKALVPGIFMMEGGGSLFCERWGMPESLRNCGGGPARIQVEPMNARDTSRVLLLNESINTSGRNKSWQTNLVRQSGPGGLAVLVGQDVASGPFAL